MRTLLVACIAIVVFAGCGGGGSSTPAASTTSTGASNSSSSAGNASSSTSTSGGSIDACKLSEADVEGVVGFAVTKLPNPEPNSCEYEATGQDGSVTVAVYKWPSQSDADLYRDSVVLPEIPGVSDAFFDTDNGPGNAVIFRSGSQVTIVLATPDGFSDSQANDALVGLIKKFA